MECAVENHTRLRLPLSAQDIPGKHIFNLKSFLVNKSIFKKTKKHHIIIIIEVQRCKYPIVQNMQTLTGVAVIIFFFKLSLYIRS